LAWRRKTKKNKFTENEIEEFIVCDCQSELIRLVYDKEVDDLFLSFFKNGHHNFYSLKNRLIHIWRIIWEGHPWTDCICLGPEARKKIIFFLEKIKGLKNETKK